MIFLGRPQERHEAWPAKSCRHAWLCRTGLSKGVKERKPFSAHLHAPFVLELGNLLCRPDAVIVLVVTAAGLRQRGKCGEDEWCPPAPHLGGWCCGLNVVLCADAGVALPGKTR